MDKYKNNYFLSLQYFSVFILCLLVILFIPAQVAIACSQMPPSVVIEAQIDKNLLSQQKSCLDKDCLILLEKDYYGETFLKGTIDGLGGYIIGRVDKEGKSIQISYDRYNLLNIEAIDKLFEDDITDIKPILFQEIESWVRERKFHFSSNNLTFTPTTKAKKFKLLKNKNQLLNCNYGEYKQVGNWLIVNYTTRDYCYLSGEGGGMCPYSVISFPKFIDFLLTNINIVTTLYLSVFLSLIIGVVAFPVYLIRKNELWLFLKPRKAKVIATIITAVITLKGYRILSINKTDIYIFYIFLIYFIACLIGYIKLKIKSIPERKTYRKTADD